MVYFFKLVGTLVAIALAVILGLWFIETNPLEYTRKEVRDFLLQLILYTFTASVAILGYWWNQKEQNKRHDDQKMEERMNKTLDLQLEALWKQTKMRREFDRKISHSEGGILNDIDLSDQPPLSVIEELDSHLSEMANHAMFYLNSDEFELVEILCEMRGTVNDLWDYLFHSTPMSKDLLNTDVEDAISDVVDAYRIKLFNISQVFDWEIGRIINGKITERYDFGYNKEEQDERFDDPEMYSEWKYKEYRDIRIKLGLTNTILYFEELEVDKITKDDLDKYGW